MEVESLKRLVSETTLDLSNLSISVESRDSVTRRYTNLDDLVRVRNLRGEEVTRISIDFGDRFKGERCSVSFRNSAFLDNVDFEATSNSEEVIGQCRLAIEAFLERQSPWWTVIGSINYSGFMTMFALAGFTWLFFWRLGDPKYIPILGFAPVLLAVILGTLVPPLFPPCSFLIGAGETRYRTREFLRVVVVVGFLISFLASIAVTELYNPG